MPTIRIPATSSSTIGGSADLPHEMRLEAGHGVEGDNAARQARQSLLIGGLPARPEILFGAGIDKVRERRKKISEISK